MMYDDETTADALEAHWLAGIDADIEMAEMRAVGRAIDHARQQGKCAHQSAVGWIPGEPVYPEQHGLAPGQLRCTEGCGRVFNSDDDWHDAMTEAIGY